MSEHYSDKKLTPEEITALGYDRAGRSAIDRVFELLDSCTLSFELNVPALQNIILKYGDNDDIIQFSRTSGTEDIQPLQQAVINSKDGEAIAAFAIDVASCRPDPDGSNMRTLQDAVIASHNGLAAAAFAIEIRGADVLALQDVVLSYGCGRDALLMTRVAGSNKEALQNKVIDCADAWSAYQFAQEVAGANIEALQEVILKGQSADAAYMFANHITGADIPALLDSVLKMPIDYGNNSTFIDLFVEHMGDKSVHGKKVKP